MVRLVIILLGLMVFSCNNQDYDLDTFVCQNAKAEYFQFKKAYDSYMSAYDALIESGEMEPEIVNGIDIGRIRWATEDPEQRAMEFVRIQKKWSYCPYIDRPEFMDEFGN